MKFTKMHGLGNDYLYVFGEVPENVAELCTKLSNRHFGAGSDGMIFISQSDTADFRMRIFNADGSEAMMCGNGIRCVGKYVFDKGYTNKTKLKIETLSGIKTLALSVKNGKVDSVTVDMGKAEVSEKAILKIGGDTLRCIPVSVGNPHAVNFVESVEDYPVETIGRVLERHPIFPGGVNVEFAQIIDRRTIRMRVWERGSGITMACGTGACATASAAVSKGFCDFGEPITVRLDGGNLKITVSKDYSITMEGPAETVYEGECEIC